MARSALEFLYFLSVCNPTEMPCQRTILLKCDRIKHLKIAIRLGKSRKQPDAREHLAGHQLSGTVLLRDT